MIKTAILCVDDETIILESLIEQLKKHFGDGYLYETAEDAQEAMEIIEELVKDEIKNIIIVTDWLMPGIKGDEFLIDVHKKYPSFIKILLTGQAKEDAITRAKTHADLFAVIHKPWIEEDLYNIIKSGLNKND
jgi:DNA-binding NtrC family response regulator